jgi:hypothetical protein
MGKACSVTNVVEIVLAEMIDNLASGLLFIGLLGAFSAA